MKNLVISMKTISKTIFGLLTLGFVLSTATAQSWAQSGASGKPMKPQALKILCERFPLNSRCTQGSAVPTSEKTPIPVGPTGGGELPSTTPSSGVTPMTPVPDNTAKPAGGGMMSPPTSETSSPLSPAPKMSPGKKKTPIPVGPSGGGALPPTTPSGGVTPSTPVPDDTAKPTGGGMMTPAAPETSTPMPAPKMSPGKDKTPIPVGPSGGGDLPPTTPSGGVTPSTPKP